MPSTAGPLPNNCAVLLVTVELRPIAPRPCCLQPSLEVRSGYVAQQVADLEQCVQDIKMVSGTGGASGPPFPALFPR